MKSEQQPESTVDTRRKKLREWIDLNCNSVQSEFLELCSRRNYELSQSELSGLLRHKSFGEKKARAIELGSGMPPYYLDRSPDSAATAAQAPISGPVLALEPSPHHRWKWPFKKVTPDQYLLLEVLEKKAFEEMILAIVKNRGQPEKLRPPAKTIATS